MTNKLLVPDIGDFEKVEIIEILVKKGDKIKKNHPIVTLESDKSSVEVPSISEGVVESVSVKIGDKVSKGDLLVTLINTAQKEEESKEKIEENIPPVTEKIIKEAEKTLVLKKEIEQPKSIKKKNVEEIKVVRFGVINPLPSARAPSASSVAIIISISPIAGLKEKTGRLLPSPSIFSGHISM